MCNSCMHMCECVWTHVLPVQVEAPSLDQECSWISSFTETGSLYLTQSPLNWGCWLASLLQTLQPSLYLQNTRITVDHHTHWTLVLILVCHTLHSLSHILNPISCSIDAESLLGGRGGEKLLLAISVQSWVIIHSKNVCLPIPSPLKNSVLFLIQGFLYPDKALHVSLSPQSLEVTTSSWPTSLWDI